MDKDMMKWLHYVAFVLVIIGGLNWGVWALVGVNFVDAVVGAWPMVARIVYILVGLSAVYLLATHMTDCKICGKQSR